MKQPESGSSEGKLLLDDLVMPDEAVLGALPADFLDSDDDSSLDTSFDTQVEMFVVPDVPGSAFQPGVEILVDDEARSMDDDQVSELEIADLIIDIDQGLASEMTVFEMAPATASAPAANGQHAQDGGGNQHDLLALQFDLPGTTIVIDDTPGPDSVAF